MGALPNCKCYISESNRKRLFFVADNGEGVLMGLSDENKEKRKYLNR